MVTTATIPTVLQHTVLLCTTPRVGQNAVLSALRGVAPGAGEHGAAYPTDGLLITGSHTIIETPPALLTHHVRLCRNDRVAQAVSWAHAAATGRFHSWQTAPLAGDVTDEDIAAGLLEIGRREQAWDVRLRGLDVLELTYEDDVQDDPMRAAARIIEFCGLTGSPVAPAIERFATDEKAHRRAAYVTSVEP